MMDFLYLIVILSTLLFIFIKLTAFLLQKNDKNASKEKSEEKNNNNTIIETENKEKQLVEDAKKLFINLQHLWDKRDLEEIKKITSIEVYENIVLDVKENPNSGKSDIVFLNAEIIKKQEIDGNNFEIYFNGLISENNEYSTIKELWKFNKTDQNILIKSIIQIND